MPDQAESWRVGASTELQAAVEKVMALLAADELYDSAAPKVSETVETLHRLADLSSEFAITLSHLSPVGQSAILEASRLQHGPIRLGFRIFARLNFLWRYRLEDAMKLAADIGSCAEVATIIKVRHMSDGPTEQGSGSSAGREPDSAVIDYAEGFEIVPFRTPKDKFAVRVIEALVMTSHPAAALKERGCQRRLESFLDSAWADMGRETRPSWTRVLKARGRIVEKVQSDASARAKTREMRSRRNTASSE